MALPPYLQQSLQKNSIGPLSTAIYTHTHKQVVQINGAWILAFDLIYYSDSLVESKSWDWVMTNLYLSKFSGAQISHLRELDHFQWTKNFIFQSHWLPVPVAALACQNPRRLQQKRNQFNSSPTDKPNSSNEISRIKLVSKYDSFQDEKIVDLCP